MQVCTIRQLFWLRDRRLN